MSNPNIRRFAHSFLILTLTLCGSFAPTNAQPPGQTSAPVQGQFTDPDARAVNERMLLRQGTRIEGSILIPDQREDVLIQPAGRTWDYFHEVLLLRFGAILLLTTVAGLVLAYFAIGALRIEGGRSGRRILRFVTFERFAHWMTASSFIVLGITGLNITFGKHLLLPLIGYSAFSTWSLIAKYAHDFTAFPFMTGLVILVALFIKDNFPQRIDVQWFRRGGGFIKGTHVSAGRFNAGEKLVFWGVLGAGAVVSISGLFLLFPFYVTNIAGMQIAQAVHSVIALLFVAMILGHIYIGTLGMEGAFEAMWTGSVDANWAREHHDLWLEDEIAKSQKKVTQEHHSSA